jgi:flavodoxin
MAKKFNLDDVIKYHCNTKNVLTEIYKTLQKDIEAKEKLMKKIKPLIEESEIKYL